MGTSNDECIVRHRSRLLWLMAGLLAACDDEPLQGSADAAPGAGPVLVRSWDGRRIAPPGVAIEPSAAGQGISGRVMLDGTTATFSSRQDAVNEIASARVKAANGTEVVTSVSMTAAASMMVGGETLSGRGPLTVSQKAALKMLAESGLAPVLATLPLEIGCQPDAHVTDLELAALLLPWQMLIKYQPQFPEVEAFERIVSCRYFEPSEQAAQTNDSSTPQLRGRRIRLANDDRVPNVFGIFPFDGQGAVAPTTSLRHDTRPCGALCFGTCGPDCDPTACRSSFEWYCLRDENNDNTGWKRVRRHWRCGTHQGCRDHDACYDNCNQSNGCNTWGATMCRRACDSLCITDQGASNCRSWMNGGGPFDAFRDYYHDIGVPDMQDPALCPMVRDGGVDGADAARDSSTGPDLLDAPLLPMGGSSGGGGAAGFGGYGGNSDAAAGGIGGNANSGGLGGGGTLGTGSTGGSGAVGGNLGGGGMGSTSGIGGLGGYGGVTGSVIAHLPRPAAVDGSRAQ